MTNGADQERLDPATRLANALGLAYAHVNRRERSVAEVAAYLERKGVSDATAAEAIGELVETQVVDDERFAAMFVADKRGLESWGVDRIRRGLRERGVDRHVAERALAEPEYAVGPAPGYGSGFGGSDSGAGDTGEDWAPRSELDRALALLRRRFPEPLRERRERERALGVLLRKGYESELALDALAAHARGEGG